MTHGNYGDYDSDYYAENDNDINDDGDNIRVTMTDVGGELFYIYNDRNYKEECKKERIGENTEEQKEVLMETWKRTGVTMTPLK